MAGPSVIYSDNPGGLPAGYTFPPNADKIVEAVSVEVNGAGAAGQFLLCLSVYTQDDKLIGRFFPAQPFNTGDSGEVTFAEAIAAGSATTPGTSCQVSKIVSAASTNATVAKAAPGSVVGWVFGNLNAAVRFLKLYDKASAPTVGTDVPRVTIPLPPGAAGHVGLPSPIAFQSGISYALTTGITDGDSGAVAASEITVSVLYI